jgi:flagellar basal-body rod modification protein FlgD
VNVAIASVNTTGPQNASKNPLTEKTVTQDDFLRLLITQLRHQDPLNPMDNQEFAAQLATFNSLGQLIDINGKLGNLQSAQSLTGQFNAASLIGKEVTTSGNAINVQSGSAAKIGYQLGAGASRVVVSIYNSAGDLVRQIAAGPQASGERSVTWDGNDARGRSAASGVYRFEIDAFDVNGKKVQAAGRQQGIVTGVRLDGSEPVLEIGELQVPLGSVTSVRSAR